MGKQQPRVPYWVQRGKVAPERHPPTRVRHFRGGPPQTNGYSLFDAPFGSSGHRAGASPFSHIPGSLQARKDADGTPLRRLIAQYHPLMRPNLCVIGVRPEDDATLADAAERAFCLTVFGNESTCTQLAMRLHDLLPRLDQFHQVQRILRKIGGLPCLPVPDGSVDGLLFQSENAFCTLDEFDGLLAEMDRVLRAGPPKVNRPPTKLAIRAKLPAAVPQGNSEYFATVLTSSGHTYRNVFDGLPLHHFIVDGDALELPSWRNPAPYFTLWLSRPQ